MAGKVKKKDHENLSDSNVEKVIKLLEAATPITKKEACEILNISYNTTRLAKIVEEYRENRARDKKLRDANRGKPVQAQEIKYTIEKYLEGIATAEIATALFRSPSFVKSIIQNVGVPTRGVGEDYTNYSPLPDKCVAKDFNNGEIAWSSKYLGPCIIEKEVSMSEDGESKVYQIYVLQAYEEPEVRYVRSVGQAGFYAYQPAHELGKLDHLKEYGIDVSKSIA